nr:hypothetical protein [Dechloromonas sp.]
MTTMPFSSHDAYFATVAVDVRRRLEAIQATVESLLREATRCIGYGMPAFRRKRIFFYFAAFRKHIGIYPPVSQDAELIAKLAPFRGPKGNLSFLLDRPLPLDLIGRVGGGFAAGIRVTTNADAIGERAR